MAKLEDVLAPQLSPAPELWLTGPGRSPQPFQFEDPLRTDAADVVVAVASIDIQKTPDTQNVISGGTALFTIDVTNSGNVNLTNVAVTDPLASDCGNAIGALAVGQTVSYRLNQILSLKVMTPIC